MSQQTTGDRFLAGLNKFLWMAGVGVLAYLGHEQDSFVTDVWTAAKTASPFAAMLAVLLFFDERRERREAQRQCNERTIEFIQSNHVAADALNRNSTAVQNLGSVVSHLVGQPTETVK